MIHIRAIAQRQVNLDQCAGAAILELRACVRTMEKSRARIEAARKTTLALLATPAGPEAVALFDRLAVIEQTVQKSVQHKWLIQRARWNALPGLGCKLRHSPERSGYPEFPYTLIEPATALAAPPLDRGPLPTRYLLRIRVARLETEAGIFQENPPKGSREWRARWTR